MKFPRNTRLLRSPFDVAPFAATFFLLVIFLMLGALLPTPGLPLQLPAAGDLPGTDKPSVAIAIDSSGRFYFANQIVEEIQLKNHLADEVRKLHEPLTLVVHADKAVTYDQLIGLTSLARGVGITNIVLATLPRIVNSPGQP